MHSLAIVGASKAARRINLSTIRHGPYHELLDRFRTRRTSRRWFGKDCSNIGIPSFICRLADRRERSFAPVIPTPASRCHPRRGIALLRALDRGRTGRVARIARPARIFPASFTMPRRAHVDPPVSSPGCAERDAIVQQKIARFDSTRWPVTSNRNSAAWTRSGCGRSSSSIFSGRRSACRSYISSFPGSRSSPGAGPPRRRKANPMSRAAGPDSRASPVATLFRRAPAAGHSAMASRTARRGNRLPCSFARAPRHRSSTATSKSEPLSVLHRILAVLARR